MSLLDLNAHINDNIDVIDIDYLGVVGYEIKDCDKLNDDNFMSISLWEQKHAQRILEYKTTDENGKIQVFRYSRCSHKESIGFREKYKINDFIYNMDEAILVDDTNEKVYEYKDIRKYEKYYPEIFKRFKMLDKAYSICFPDEINTLGKNLGDLERQYIQDLNEENRRIGVYNRDKYKNYIVIEQSKLRAFRKDEFVYLGTSPTWVTPHIYERERKLYDFEQYKREVNKRCFKVENLSELKLKEVIKQNILFTLGTIYIEKSTGLPISVVITGYESTESGLWFKWVDLDYKGRREKDRGIKVNLQIKIVVIRHAQKDVKLEFNKEINTDLVTSYASELKSLNPYLIDSSKDDNKVEYQLRLPLVYSINTFEDINTKSKFEVYELEDTPEEFRDQVFSLLCLTVNGITTNKYNNLFGYNYANNILLKKRVKSMICRGVEYDTMYNVDSLSNANYIEDPTKVTQAEIIKRFGHSD